MASSLEELKKQLGCEGMSDKDTTRTIFDRLRKEFDAWYEKEYRGHELPPAFSQRGPRLVIDEDEEVLDL